MTPPSDPPSAGLAAGRRRWLRGGVLVALVVALVAGLLIYRGRDSSTPLVPDTRAMVTPQVGVFRGDDPGQVKEFSTWLGRDVTYAETFTFRSTWAQIAEPQTQLATWQNSGYRMIYSVALLPDEPADTIQRGATGEYDKYYTDLAQRLIATGQANAIIRLGWEFNIQGSRWATPDTASFIAFWRHVVAAMRAQPGQQFQFDFNPNNGDSAYDAVNYYPGDDVVDYIGIDAYDNAWADGSYPYPTNCDQTCRTKAQKTAWDKSIYGGARGLKFWSTFAREKHKPMSIPEWGVWNRTDAHGGGDDPDYIKRMHTFITDPTNRVAYQSYFEYDGADGTHRLMTTFPQSGQTYKDLFAK